MFVHVQMCVEYCDDTAVRAVSLSDRIERHKVCVRSSEKNKGSQKW